MSENQPRFDLTDQIVLVTGAARGIGRAIALACAHAGADIALGVRVLQSAPPVVAEIAAIGRRVLPLQMDVQKLGEIASAIETASRHFGRIDVLVNNAGLGPENPAIDVNEPDYDLTFDVNVKGTFFASQAAARVMMKRKSGRIINISSQAGTNVLPGEAIYCASKAAIDHLTRCLAREWAADGITVNSIAPTFILTDGTRSVLENETTRRAIIDHIPLGRVGQQQDVAGAVIFLASPAGSMITGTVLAVDGGWSVA